MFLDFEKEVVELEERIRELKALPTVNQLKIQDEIQRLERKSRLLLRSIYRRLTPWQKVLVARHPQRPHAIDYIQRLASEFVPLAGDRKFSEDSAIIGGLARFNGRPVMLIGHEKGSDTQSRLKHNFGMAHPEGYRKVVRLFDLAHRYSLPVIMLVDTPGAYAGTGAEERGQFEAIAACIEKSLCINTPIISIVIGEGGSGGAIALAVADHIIMLEHSVYSVISPEGCASILWRTVNKKEEAAAAQKLTAQDLLAFKVIDEVIQEPLGGAHRNRLAIVDATGDAITRKLQEWDGRGVVSWKDLRREKFLNMGRAA